MLEGLEEDLDLRAFLPGRDVEVGESWDIDAMTLASLVMPGGSLGLKPAEMSEDGPDMGEFEDMITEMFGQYEEAFTGLLEGERKATYEGVRDVDGRSLAVITLKLDTDGSMDMSGMLADMVDKISELAEEMPDFELDIAAANLSVTLDGTGTLLWDPRRGTFESLTLEVDMTFGMEVSVDLDAQGETHSMDMTMEMAGDMASNFKAE